MQGLRAQNATHWMLTITSAKTSRTLSLPLDTDIPYGHHSIPGIIHTAASILVTVRAPLAHSAVSIVSPKDLEQKDSQRE